MTNEQRQSLLALCAEAERLFTEGGLVHLSEATHALIAAVREVCGEVAEMGPYQADLVAAGKRYKSTVFERTVRIRSEYWMGREFTEAEAVVVGQMLLKGAAELARRREAGK